MHPIERSSHGRRGRYLENIGQRCNIVLTLKANGLKREQSSRSPDWIAKKPQQVRDSFLSPRSQVGQSRDSSHSEEFSIRPAAQGQQPLDDRMPREECFERSLLRVQLPRQQAKRVNDKQVLIHGNVEGERLSLEPKAMTLVARGVNGTFPRESEESAKMRSRTDC